MVMRHWPGTPPVIAGIVPPVSGMGRVPGTIAPVTKPQVLLPIVRGLATVTPTGSVSATLTAVAIDALGLSRTMVSVDTCPATTELGLKLLLMPTAANAEVVSKSASAPTQARRRVPASGIKGIGIVCRPVSITPLKNCRKE